MRDLILTTENWQARAACRDTDPEVMQPEVATRLQIAEAKALCVGCPVALQCKAMADDNYGTYGVHAGEWYGPNPGTADTCDWCGVELVETTSHKRRYCGGTCQKRASRAAAAATSAA